MPITFYDKFKLGSGGVDSDYFYEAVVGTDATVTPCVFEPDMLGYDDFYLVDLWIENSGKATTSVRTCVTTSTSNFINADNVAYLDGDDGTCTLMKTLGNAFGADGAAYNSQTATNSVFYLRQYPGTDTRLAAGTNPYPFLVNSTTNIMVYATSGAAVNDDAGITASGNTYDVILHIIGMEADR